MGEYHGDSSGLESTGLSRPSTVHLFSSADGRLRVGWRISIFIMMFLGVFIILGIPLHLFISDELTATTLLILTGAELVAVTLAALFSRRILDRKTFRSLGFSRYHAFPDLLFGFLLGGVLIGVQFILLWKLGWLEITGYAWQQASTIELCTSIVILLFGIGLFTGWSEELAFRGYLLANISEGMSLPLAMVLSSLIFGMVHAGNPNSNGYAILGIVLAGLMLAYGRIRTGLLWLPIGLHAGWNLFQALFGFPVSGVPLFSLFTTRISGPPLVTGGAFGPEAGLIIVPVILLGIVGIHFWTKLNTPHSHGDAQ